jgi:hypothetical protein
VAEYAVQIFKRMLEEEEDFLVKGHDFLKAPSGEPEIS